MSTPVPDEEDPEKEVDEAFEVDTDDDDDDDDFEEDDD